MRILLDNHHNVNHQWLFQVIWSLLDDFQETIKVGQIQSKIASNKWMFHPCYLICKEFTESENILSWNGPTRIKFTSWPRASPSPKVTHVPKIIVQTLLEQTAVTSNVLKSPVLPSDPCGRTAQLMKLGKAVWWNLFPLPKWDWQYTKAMAVSHTA